MTDTVFGVSDYLDLINQKISEVDIIVEGEITSVSNRGHIYFDICEEKNGEKAILACALWKFRADRLPFELSVGEKIQVSGKANIYKPYGKFSFIVEKISPTGEGALKKAFEKLKNDLQQRGYFAQERKRQLPIYPNKIAVLTSKNGDAIKDFRTHLGNFGITISHLDCRVEGIRAIDEIINGIRYLNTNYPDLEVIVLTRGGGSLESLQAYNSLEVAEAIFTSKIPILSAVGHENDITISDLVADVRASTPTAAGQLLSKNWREAQSKLIFFSHNLDNKSANLIEELRNKLIESWQKNYETVSSLIHRQQEILSRSTKNFSQQIRWRISEYKHTEEKFFRNYHIFDEKLLQRLENVQYFDNVIDSKFTNLIKSKRERLLFYDKHLQLADPQLRLKQGYSIIRNTNNTIVKSIFTLKENDELTLQFHSGTATSIVNKISKES